MAPRPVAWLRDLDRRTRPVDPETERIHRERWQELPELDRQENQVLLQLPPTRRAGR